MNAPFPCPADTGLPIAAVERETGLAKDTLRVWEKRYGFPQPLRDACGDRLYPAAQVQQLQLIRRLLDAGLRPGKVVGLDGQALEQLLTQHSSSAAAPALSKTKTPAPEQSSDLEALLDAIAAHDPHGLRHALHHPLREREIPALRHGAVEGLLDDYGRLAGEVRKLYAQYGLQYELPELYQDVQ